MPRFIFTLEPVLDHRKRIEDQSQRELARHLRQQMILMDQLRQMQQTIRASKHDLADGLIGRVDMTRVSDFARYAGQTSIRAQQIVQRLAGLQQQIDAARQKLMEATRQRKALELLRDRRLAAWRQQEERRQTAELDDLTLQRHLRESPMGAAA